MKNSIKLGLYKLNFKIQMVGTDAVCAGLLFVIDNAIKLFS